MARIAPCLLLLASLAAADADAARAQDRIELPGRQIVDEGDFLVEVTYTASRVLVRVFDTSGRPVDMSRLWLRRCLVSIRATRPEGESSAQRAVRLVVPEDGQLPYLEARHQLGHALRYEQVVVSVRLKNLGGRGDHTTWIEAVWERAGCELRADCRGEGCALCVHGLCRGRHASRASAR